MQSTTILSTKGNAILIDRSDLEKVRDYRWYEDKDGYAFAVIRSGGEPKRISMHRMLLDVQRGMDVDHINRNPRDNRKCNLRLCTRSQNNMNSKARKTNKSGYKNICWDKQMNSWKVQIMRDYKVVYEKLFKKLEEAVRARNKALIFFHGAYVNKEVLCER